MAGTTVSGRNDGRRRSQAKKNRRKSYLSAMLLISAVVCVLSGVLYVHSLHIKEAMAGDMKTVEELNAELAREQARTVQIELTKERLHSDEFVKDAAENRLGLVPEDGYVLREKTE